MAIAFGSLLLCMGILSLILGFTNAFGVTPVYLYLSCGLGLSITGVFFFTLGQIISKLEYITIILSKKEGMPEKYSTYLEEKNYPQKHRLRQERVAADVKVIPCPQCGTEINQRATICPKCKTKFESGELARAIE